MGTRRVDGMSIEKNRIPSKFDYEVRFRKDIGQFFAVVPPGEKLTSDSLEGLKTKVRAYAGNYKLPGAWVKKIHITSEARNGGRWYNGFDEREAGFKVGWFLFEEREVSPVGQRIARPVGSSHEGRDERHTLEGGHTVLWTQEREDMLVTLRDALNALHSKLEGMLKTPELLAGLVKMLPAHTPADEKEPSDG